MRSAIVVGIGFWVALIGVSAARSEVRDPAAPGPYVTMETSYSLGDEVFAPTDFPAPGAPRSIEITGVAYHPVDLGAGPFPLVVAMHGAHRACSQSAFADWPCGSDGPPIPSYRGFDYFGERLASHGYIVVSISVNGLNLLEGNSAIGMNARAELIDAHIELWRLFNDGTLLPFLELVDPALADAVRPFVGRVDLSTIGLIGHSRGGEGVAHFLADGFSSDWKDNVRGALLVAPTDGFRKIPVEKPSAVLLGYCDGDVPTMDGVHYFDDLRYGDPDGRNPKYFLFPRGANHNFFNRIWTPGFADSSPRAADDGNNLLGDPFCDPDEAGNQRLSDEEQRDLMRYYGSAFLRAYLGGEQEFLPILSGGEPIAPSLGTDDVLTSYHAPEDPRLRRDLNRFDGEQSLSTNALGGAVVENDLTVYRLCGGTDPQPEHCLDVDPVLQPHTFRFDVSPPVGGLSQLQLQWKTPGAYYENRVPFLSRNVSGYSSVKFRVAVNFDADENAVGEEQNFSVVLRDRLFREARVAAADYSRALYYPPGGSTFGGFGVARPSVVHNMVDIPLAAFSGIDLNNLAAVRFEFDRKATGDLLISDLAFANPTGALVPLQIDSGSASALPAPFGQLQLSASFLSPNPLNLNEAVLTFYQALDEGGEESLSTGAVSFRPQPGALPWRAVFDSPLLPDTEVTVTAIGLLYLVRVEIEGETLTAPDGCNSLFGTPTLTTSLQIDDGSHTPVRPTVSRPWLCFGGAQLVAN